MRLILVESCGFNVEWLGDHPIFFRFDEALQCKNGTEEGSLRLQCLLTAAGAFLDNHNSRNCVFLNKNYPIHALLEEIRSI